jgi:hypothetical protein
MCVITDQDHKVISISLIPGVGNIPSCYHVYFPVTEENLPEKGDIFKPNEYEDIWRK